MLTEFTEAQEIALAEIIRKVIAKLDAFCQEYRRYPC